MISLYPDQSVVKDAVRDAMRSSKAILLQASPGFGKTRLTAAMIEAAAIKGTRTMFVVPRRELLAQTAETFNGFGIEHSYVSAKYELNPFVKTMIATSGTLARRIADVPVPKLVFFDETHHGGAELNRIIQHYKDAGSWVVGLSGTPERLDGRGLGCWYDVMVEGLPPSELIEMGRLSEYRLFAPDAPDMTGIRKTAGDYAKGALADKMEGDRVLVGNAVKHYRQHAMGMISIGFCVSIKHAEIMAQAFRDDGLKSEVIHGGLDDAQRKELILALARGGIHELQSVDLLTFGFDLSMAAKMDVRVQSIGDYAPTQSLPKQVQKWFRALRAGPTSIIRDHAGNSARHGLPDDAREWSLADKPKGTQGGGEKAEPVRQCQDCYFVHHPTPTCPNCGFEYPIASRDIKEVEGELLEVTAANKPPKKSQVIGRIAREGGRKGLEQYAKENGYKSGWVSHQLRVRKLA